MEIPDTVIRDSDHDAVEHVPSSLSLVVWYVLSSDRRDARTSS